MCRNEGRVCAFILIGSFWYKCICPPCKYVHPHIYLRLRKLYRKVNAMVLGPGKETCTPTARRGEHMEKGQAQQCMHTSTWEDLTQCDIHY